MSHLRLDKLLDTISREEKFSELYEAIRINGKMGPSPRLLSVVLLFHLETLKIDTSISRTAFFEWMEANKHLM